MHYAIPENSLKKSDVANLEKAMRLVASNLDFEEATRLRDRLLAAKKRLLHIIFHKHATTALIQTIGRAARNSESYVILGPDNEFDAARDRRNRPPLRETEAF